MLNACKKEKGCTDPTASNYNSNAQEEDNSCLFPTLEDNITGAWSFQWTSTTGTNSPNPGISTKQEGQFLFNFDGTGVLTKDLKDAPIIWSVSQDSIFITQLNDSITSIFLSKINTPIEQKWEGQTLIDTITPHYSVQEMISMNK